MKQVFVIITGTEYLYALREINMLHVTSKMLKSYKKTENHFKNCMLNNEKNVLEKMYKCNHY